MVTQTIYLLKGSRDYIEIKELWKTPSIFTSVLALFSASMRYHQTAKTGAAFFYQEAIALSKKIPALYATYRATETSS